MQSWSIYQPLHKPGFSFKGWTPVTPPTPPPTPAAPTPRPTPPAGKKWECHVNMSVTPQGVRDVDHQDRAYSVGSCEAACEATAGCGCLRLHQTDSHCHTLAGNVTRDAFLAGLTPMPEYVSCLLVDVGVEKPS